MKYIFSFIAFIFLFSGVYAQQKAELRISVEGMKNTEGKLSITLFNQADGFPEDIDKAYKWRTIEINSEKPEFVFGDLAPGRYAYSILHDEDGNGEMNKNIIGIPREGFAFSDNYVPRIKTPSFSDASVNVNPGLNHHSVEMVYP